MVRVSFGAALVLGCLSVSACAPIVSHRGYFADPRKTDAVSVGVDTKASVQDRLGTPTQVATFDPNTWYYMSSTEHIVAWNRPQTINQTILAVSFDAEGKVSKVDKLDKVPPRHLAMVNRATPTRGRELTVWEQILGNVGRMPNRGGEEGSGRTGPRPDRGDR